MELKVFAQEAVRRLDDFRLAVPREELHHAPSIATRTFERLPLKFTRRGAA